MGVGGGVGQERSLMTCDGRWGSPDDQWGPHDDGWDPSHDRWGASDDGGGPPDDRWGFSDDRWGPPVTGGVPWGQVRPRSDRRGWLAGPRPPVSHGAMRLQGWMWEMGISHFGFILNIDNTQCCQPGDIIRLLIFLWLHEGCSRKGETGSKNTDLNGEKGGFQPTLGNNQELLRQQTPERFWRWKPWTCWESLSICAGNLYLSQPLYVCLWKLMTLRTFTVNSLQAGDSLEAGILCH